jgi:hypothetical protein
MNPSNIVQCLAELVKADLNANQTEVSQQEPEAGQCIAETITTFADCKQFEYDEMTTLDSGNQSDDYDSSADEKIPQDDENLPSVDDD